MACKLVVVRAPVKRLALVWLRLMYTPSIFKCKAGRTKSYLLPCRYMHTTALPCWHISFVLQCHVLLWFHHTYSIKPEQHDLLVFSGLKMNRKSMQGLPPKWNLFLFAADGQERMTHTWLGPTVSGTTLEASSCCMRMLTDSWLLLRDKRRSLLHVAISHKLTNTKRNRDKSTQWKR